MEMSKRGKLTKQTIYLFLQKMRTSMHIPKTTPVIINTIDQIGIY